MRKFTKIAVCVLVLAVLAGVRPAAAEEKVGFYGRLGYLHVMPPDSDVSGVISGDAILEDGWGILGAFGYDFGKFRAEIEASMLQMDMDKFRGRSRFSGTFPVDGDVKAFTLMANAYVDIGLSDIFDLYGGVGAGIAILDAKIRTLSLASDDTDIIPAGQLMGGLSAQVSEKVAVYGGYRFLRGVKKADFDGLKASVSTHNLEVGLLFRF